MAIRIDTAIVQGMMMLCLVCGFAVAGEVIIVAPTNGGGASPPDPAQTSRDAAIDNALKARTYSDPGKGSPSTVIIVSPNGPAASTADKNREALLRNRLNARTQSQGQNGSRTGNTLVILPGTPSGTPNSQAPLDAAMDRARAYSEGDAGRRPCTSATVSVGTVGSVVAVDRSGDPTSAAQGVNTVAVGGCR